jgi:flavin-binding protein dodecin
MAKILKVIEILSESPNNWEEATQNVVTEASKTLRNIRSVYIKASHEQAGRFGLTRTRGKSYTCLNWSPSPSPFASQSPQTSIERRRRHRRLFPPLFPVDGNYAGKPTPKC